jgi:membrane-associated phospholipid phosphatase
MTLQLPQLPVTERNKLWLAVAVGLITIVLYGVSGLVTVGLDPRHLPMSPIDRAVPLMPWTFWIYASVYCIYTVSCILQRDLEAFGKFLYGYLFAYTVSCLFFVAFPTVFPREAYPVGGGYSGDSIVWSEAALGWFRTYDNPTNCFPSMHVGSAVLVTAPFYKKRPVVFAVFCVWAFAISVTTVTTKQHYAVDVLAGAVFALCCHMLAHHWVGYFVVEKSTFRARQPHA